MKKWILSWIVAGFVAYLLGLIIDLIFYDKKQKWDWPVFFLSLFLGYATYFLVLRSAFYGMWYMTKERKRNDKGK